MHEQQVLRTWSKYFRGGPKYFETFGPGGFVLFGGAKYFVTVPVGVFYEIYQHEISHTEFIPAQQNLLNIK